MRKKSDLGEEDLVQIYDLAFTQSKEDRILLLNAFNSLREIISTNPDRFVVSGDVLAKLGDLLVKQTSQVIELVKVLQKQKEKDEVLTTSDWEKISDALKPNNEQ